MKKRQSTEDKLAALRSLEKAPLTQEALKTLRSHLAGANNIIVAKAVKIVGDRSIADMTPLLLNIFERFLKNPLKKDPGCLAKEAVIEALENIDYAKEDIFLRGIRYFQLEPAYGKPVDTAAVLRGKCAFALVRIGFSDIVFELTTLLTDTEPQVRIAAIRSLTGLPGIQSEPLLRLKAAFGDKDHQVIAECFAALMQLNPLRSIPFIETYLKSGDLLVAQSAAFALGESRRKDAFDILKKYREQTFDSERRDMLLPPIAVLRREDAFEYLIDVIKNDDRYSSATAAKVIEIFGDDSHFPLISETVKLRNDILVSKAFTAWKDRQR